ncbi:hypothetical protein [Photobacterium leiognathi]|uniref:hypothetical protein n=1 Tax=Photobacterium leiognathi TaxID=553611 RepID=UPI00298192CA|nr:hypothetical protein [Photobacterium leiognathi]
MIRYYLLFTCSILLFLFAISNYINLQFGTNLNGLWRAYEVHKCVHEKPIITEKNLKIVADHYNVTLMEKDANSHNITVFESKGKIDYMDNNCFNFNSSNAVLNQSYKAWLNHHLSNTNQRFNSLHQGKCKLIYQNANVGVIEYQKTNTTVIYTKLT